MTWTELVTLVAHEVEEAFGSKAHHDGQLAFSRRGLRIYRNPDRVTYRCYVAADYSGPDPNRYIEVLHERDLEEALVDSYLEMTPETRRARLTQGERIGEALSNDGTSAHRSEGATVDQQAVNGSRPTRPRARSARPTTRGMR